MYEYADKILQYLRKRFIRLFRNFKAQPSFDELNVLSSSKALYQELEQITEECLLMIAKQAYQAQGGKFVELITHAWLLGWLNQYDPVTKYVYNHEVERKCSRFAESVIASTNKAKEIDTALRYWSNMVSQYAIEITDKATEQAYRDNGVEQVMWVTVKDERRCKECRERDGKIYDIDKIPPKPHIGCRCYKIPYWGGTD